MLQITMNGLERNEINGPAPKAIDAAALPLDDLMITQAWADTSRLFFFEPLILDRIDEEREALTQNFSVQVFHCNNSAISGGQNFELRPPLPKAAHRMPTMRTSYEGRLLLLA